MSADSDGDPIEKAIGMCTMVQSMIDFTAKNLYGLRTRCATTEEITQKEIRDTETKLIKLFSRQLVAKAKLAPDEIPEKLAEYPKTDQWLIVVGIHPDIVKEVMERGVTIDTLLDMSEVEVRNFLRRYHTDDDDYEDAANKLSVALQNLKQWTERQLQGDKGTDSEVDLHWTSYYHKSTSSSPFSGSSPKHGQRPSTSSLPPDTYLNTPGSPAPSPGPTLPTPPQSTPSSPAPRTSGDKYRYTPPPTPPLARAKATSSSKYPSTPPPKRKIQLAPDAAFPLTKSKSHESQLANRVTDVDATNKYLASTSPRTQKKKPHNLKIGGSYEALNRRRLSTDGSEVGSISSHAPSGHMSPAVSSPIRSPPFKQQDLPTVFDDFSKPNTLTVPRSPKTFYGPRMLHSINHRFTSTFQITTCDHCHKQMFLGYKCKECKLITKIVFGACDICHKNMMRGKICKDCKFKCHRDCAGKAAAACCLPNEYVEVFIESLRDGSPNPSRRLLAPGSSPSSISDIGVLKPVMSVPVFTTVPPPPPDTSSSATSSCNSSTPSSPALVMMTSPASMATSPSPAPSPSPQIQVTQFTFPGEHMSLSSSSSAVSQSRMSPCSSASYVSLVSPYSNLPPHSSNLNLNLHPPTSSASVHDSLQSSNNGSALSDHTLHGDYIYQRPRSNSAQSLQLVIRDSIPSMHDPGAGSDSVSTSISVTGSNYPGPSPEVLVTDMSANSPLGSPVASPLKRRTTPRSQTVASIASVGAYCNPPIPISPDPGVRASSLAQLHESPPSSPGYHTKYYDPGHRLSWTNNENRCMSIDAGYRSRFSSIAYRKKSFDSIVSAWSSPRTRRKKSFESGQALSLESPKTGRRRFWDPLMADWTDPKHRRRAESNAKGSKMAMLARANPYLLQQSHGSVPTLAAYDSPQTRKKSFESLINALSSPKIKKKSHDSTGPLPTWGEPPKSEKKKIHGSIPLLLWDSPKIRKKTFDGWGSPKTPKRSMDSPKITKKFDKPKPVYKPIESQIQVWSYGNPMTRKKSYDSIFANWSSPKIRKKSYEKLHIAGWDSPVQLRKRSMDYTGMNWSAAPSSRRNSFDPSSLTVSPVCPLSPSYRKKSFDRSTLSQKIKSAFQSFIGTSTPDISSHSPPHHKNPSLAVHTNDSRLFLSAPPSPSFLPPGFTYSPETPRLILTSAGQAQPVYLDVADDGFFMDSCADLDMHEYRSTSSDVDVVNTNTSNDSDKTLVDSNASERTLPERVDSMDSQDDPFGHNWDRQNSLSVALKEWDIPYEELQLAERIGIGRFGTVHKGHWHGDVAIKMVKMDPETNDDAQLSAFKLEVAMLRKTRHDNLVLFMGACMKPPHLAIVTSLCKGKTLYTQIHVMRDKFGLNKSVLVGSQVAQGMGYLHARGIIHKDLKTKNIFLEKERVVITDFGLFSVTRLCHENRKDQCLTIPSGWLCYLSPEIMRSLKAGNRHTNMDLPFTEESDVYAFGTVWYELLTGEWPFRRQPPESLIWQVGRGIKQSLSVIGLSKEVKDILLLCWAYHASNRPDFSKLLRTLERLPKKKLIRSPSHPIHLSRSAESVI